MPDDFPEAFLVEYSVNAAPPLGSERHDGRALDARQHLYNIFHAFGRDIHKYILLIIRSHDRLNPEEQLFEDFFLLVVKILIGDEQRLALHHHFHLLEVVADERRSRADNIENAVSQANTRCNFHRSLNDMNINIDSLLLHERFEDFRI